MRHLGYLGLIVFEFVGYRLCQFSEVIAYFPFDHPFVLVQNIIEKPF